MVILRLQLHHAVVQRQRALVERGHGVQPGLALVVFGKSRVVFGLALRKLRLRRVIPGLALIVAGERRVVLGLALRKLRGAGLQPGFALVVLGDAGVVLGLALRELGRACVVFADGALQPCVARVVLGLALVIALQALLVLGFALGQLLGADLVGHELLGEGVGERVLLGARRLDAAGKGTQRVGLFDHIVGIALHAVAVAASGEHPEGHGEDRQHQRKAQQGGGEAAAVAREEARDGGVVPVDGRGGDEAVAQHQDLRQREEDQQQRDNGAGADVVAHAGNDALGDLEADQQAGADHHEPGGDDGGERDVQRADDRLAAVHGLAELLVAGGDHDRIVDVRAHLDGADDQVAEEEDVIAPKRGDGKVDPYAALNDEDQQQRHTEGFKGEKQDHHDQHQRYESHHPVVRGEGFLEVLGADRVAGQADAAVVIVLRHHAHALEEGEGLVRLDRQIQIQHEAAVILAPERRADHAQPAVKPVDHVLLRGRERHRAVLGMIVQEEEEVEQACAVALQILRRRAVLALSGRVIGEDRLRGRLVDLREAGEVAEADLVAELQAVLDLDRGDARGAFDLAARGELAQQRFLRSVIPRGHEHRDQIAAAERVLDLGLRHLPLRLVERRDGVLRVGVVGLSE